MGKANWRMFGEFEEREFGEYEERNLEDVRKEFEEGSL